MLLLAPSLIFLQDPTRPNVACVIQIAVLVDAAVDSALDEAAIGTITYNLDI